MKLFLGLIFVLLDFEVTARTAVIGLLPDFVGYFLIMKGLEDRNDPWRHLAFGLGLLSLVLFVADLVVKDTGIQVAVWCVELLMGTWMLVLIYRIVGNHKGPRALFPVVACFQVLTMLLRWLPLVGTVCAAANGAVAVCFLAAAYGGLAKEEK